MILCRQLRERPSQWKSEAQTDSGTETVRFIIHNAHGQLLINRSVHSYTAVSTKNDSSHSDFHPVMAHLRFEPKLPATRSLGQKEQEEKELYLYIMCPFLPF
jgi:hypothetical protein